MLQFSLQYNNIMSIIVNTRTWNSDICRYESHAQYTEMLEAR